MKRVTFDDLELDVLDDGFVLWASHWESVLCLVDSGDERFELRRVGPLGFEHEEVFLVDVPESKPSPSGGGVCWEHQAGLPPLKLSFSVKVF